MRRLIDAKPLMADGWHLVKTGESNKFLASMSLADTPTVDAVEVVRCKDCKWFTNSNIDRGVCEMERDACGISAVWYINDYCSYGERRTDV